MLARPCAPAAGARCGSRTSSFGASSPLAAQRPAGRASWGRGSSSSLAVAASGDQPPSAFAEGARVKVVKPVKVFHAPKQPEGLDLNGMEGVVAANVSVYKGKHLSANLPYRVQFEVQRDGKAAKLICHLEEEELEAV